MDAKHVMGVVSMVVAVLLLVFGLAALGSPGATAIAAGALGGGGALMYFAWRTLSERRSEDGAVDRA